MEKLTPTQQRIYDVLADRKQHRSKDLLRKCMDRDDDLSLLRCHISLLRRKLKGSGETVMTEIVNNKAYYRLINLSEISA